MSKHTPGPWLYRAKSDSVHKPPAEQPYQFGDLIFRFHDECGPNNEDLALILAVPELLEACKVALGIIGFGAEHDQISAAIAKATGEMP